MGPDDESEGVPVWGAYFFSYVPIYWDTYALEKPERVLICIQIVKCFLKIFQKNSKNSSGRCEVDYLLATRKGQLWG